MIDQSKRAALVAEARDLYLRLWPDHAGRFETHACLFHAVALQGLLAREGLVTMLQAGTAAWPMLRAEDDDGVRSTHFGYEWQGLRDPLTRAMVQSGRLPELHVWLAHRDPDTLIDPTTGTWQLRAQRGGYPAWTAPAPPPFLWTTTTELEALQEEYPLGIRYVPDLTACKIADALAGQEIYPRVAAALGFGGPR